MTLRLLLDEYTAEVGRMRRVATSTGEVLNTVRRTIRSVQGVQAHYKIDGDSAPSDQ